MIWHQQEVKAVLAELMFHRRPSSPEEAGNRLAKFGRNVLVEKGTPLLVGVCRSVPGFHDPRPDRGGRGFGLLGEAADAIAILIIVLLNAAIGVTQEYRRKGHGGPQQMAAPSRGSFGMKDRFHRWRRRLSRDPGVAGRGVIVPADMRLTEAAVLKVEEAALTGESVPVEKNTSGAARGDASGRPLSPRAPS